MSRKFTDQPAVAANMAYAFAVTGYAGSGKTLTTLLLAAGAARAMGAEVWCIDTDSRAQEYAADVPFRHVAMDAPYSPADYLAAVQYAIGKGARVIVIDSMSDEHDGEGGILEMHARSGSKGLSSWQPVKDERNKLERYIRQQWKAGVVFGFTYRAKLQYKPKTPDEKVRMNSGEVKQDPTDHSWNVSTTSDLPYMCSYRLLLPPGSDGCPLLKPTTAQERVFVKTTRTFEKLLGSVKQVTEQTGFDLYNLSKGTGAKPAVKTKAPTTAKFHPDFADATGLVSSATKSERANYLLFLDEREQRAEGEAKAKIAAHADAVHRIAEELGDYATTQPNGDT